MSRLICHRYGHTQRRKMTEGEEVEEEAERKMKKGTGEKKKEAKNEWRKKKERRRSIRGGKGDRRKCVCIPVHI